MAQAKKTDEKAVLKVAIALLEEQGRDALSLRAIAKTLEVKAPSLSRYFAGKAALGSAIAEEGKRLLVEELRAAARKKKPRHAFASKAVTYVAFARSRPALYRFMMEPRADASASGEALWKVVLGVVGDVSGMPDDPSMAMAVWSFLHGFAMLEGPGRFGEPGPAAGFESGLEALLAYCEDTIVRKNVKAISEYLGFKA